MNTNQLNSVGAGGYFPIKLEKVIGENGKPEKVILDGKEVDKISWRPLVGDIALIKQNLTALIVFQLGQRIRQENFGTRVYECIEEPNTQALEYLIKSFLKEGIETWEPRIASLGLETKRQGPKIHITIRFRVRNLNSVEELNLSYNSQNETIDVS